ncbi:PKD domain-containing protein [Croceimicrobium sp.]|uniref:PKD domain-containing protein n=1 Tax=Croceimicrobium sp. TaxID=2828340 RepID=UPI003BAACE9E
MNKFVFWFFSCFLFSSVAFGQVCPTPQSLESLAIDEQQALLDWQSSSSHWQLRYGQGNSQIISPILINSKPYSLSALNPASNYWVQVRDSCGLDSLGPWSDTLFLRTRCSAISSPWLEDFEGQQWSRNNNGNNLLHVDSCYRFSADSLAQYWTIQTQSAIANSGPSQDHSANGQQFLYQVRNFGITQHDSVFFESPTINLSGLNNPELSYWYHFYGDDIEDFRIWISANSGLSFQLLDALNGPQQNSSNSPWLERRNSLAAYSGQSIILRFVAKSAQGGFAVGMALDDIKIDEQAACPSPLLPATLLSRSSQSLVLNLPPSSSNSWQIEYGPLGFNPGSGTTQNASQNPYTLNNLSPGTEYDIYVRELCPGSLTSNPSPKLKARTACNAQMAPYQEDFEGSNFSTAAIGSLHGNIDPCWISSPDHTFFWTVGPPVSQPVNTGPLGDHSTGSGQYLFSETESFSALATESSLSSPAIDLSALSQPQLRFYYHLFGADIAGLNILVVANGNINLIDSLNGPQQISRAEVWKEKIIDLSAYTNQEVQIVFTAKKSSNGFANHIAIDDFYLEETPTCPKPINLQASALGTQVQLSWTSSASNWIIEYGPKGFSPGNGFSFKPNSNPFTINGLSPNTEYDFYIQDSCGANLLSSQEFFGTVKTDCSAQSSPFLETFDGSSFNGGSSIHQAGTIDPCWRRNETQSFFWKARGTGAVSTQTGPSADHTSGSGKSMQTVISNFVNATQEIDLSSPPIELSSLQSPQLRFFHHLFGADIESLKVLIKNKDSVSTVLQLNGAQVNSNSAPWTEELIDLSAWQGDTIVLIFRGRRKNNYFYRGSIAIDDVEIRETPSCPAPTNLMVLQQNGSSVVLDWTSGGANQWQIEYGTPGFSPGNGTLVNVSSKPFTLSNLNPKSNYDVFVRDSCGSSSLSLWSGRVSVFTGCLVMAAPFLEDFNGPSFQRALAAADQGIFDTCWSAEDHPNFFWKIHQGQVFTFNTGPNAGNGGTGKYLFSTKSGFGNTPLSTAVYTPWIDLSNLILPELRFFSHAYGADIDKLVIEVNDGQNWQMLSTFNGSPQTSGAAAWQENLVSLQAYLNDTIQLRFVSHRKNTFSALTALALDDIEIRETPTCAFPTALQQDSASSNSIHLSWQSGGANQWQIGYRPAGSSQAYQIINVGTNPYELRGLSPSSSYEIIVRDSCGLGDLSFWSGLLIGSTNCGVRILPYRENFDGGQWVSGTGQSNAGSVLDPCWSTPSSAGPHFGPRTGITFSNTTGPSTDVSGTGNYLYTEATNGVGTGEITGPHIFIPQNQGVIWLKWAYHMYGLDIGDFEIEIRINGGPFQNLYSLNGMQQTSSADAWQEDSLSLQAYVNDTIQLRFKGSNSGYRGDIALDDIRIEGNQTLCQTPDSLQILTVGTDSIQIKWNSYNGTSSRIKLSTLEPSGAAPQWFYGVQSPFTLSNLQEGVLYRIEVSDSCSASAQSYTDSLVIRTQCLPLQAGAQVQKLGLDLYAHNRSIASDSVAWYIGNQLIGTSDSVHHQFNSPGNYTLKLVALNSCGEKDSLFQMLTICDSMSPAYQWTYNLDSLYLEADTASGAQTVYWYLNSQYAGMGWQNQSALDTSGILPIAIHFVDACGDTLKLQDTLRYCPPVWAAWTDSIVNLQGQGGGMRVYFNAKPSRNAQFYQWSFGDGSSGSGKQVVHTYSSYSLNYNVRLIVRNACGASDTTERKLGDIGLAEYAIPRISAYPNPFRDEVYIDWEGNTELDIELLDSQGRVLGQVRKNPRNRAESWTLDQLAPGVYYLRVRQGPHRVSLRLLHL